MGQPGISFSVPIPPPERAKNARKNEKSRLLHSHCKENPRLFIVGGNVIQVWRFWWLLRPEISFSVPIPPPERAKNARKNEKSRLLHSHCKENLRLFLVDGNVFLSGGENLDIGVL